MISSGNPFGHLIPNDEDNNENEKIYNNSNVNPFLHLINQPEQPKKLENLGWDEFINKMGFNKQGLQERAAGAQRGLKDLADTALQLKIAQLGGLGVTKPNAYQDITKNIQAERAAYAETPQGKNQRSELIRSGVSNLPMTLALGPLGLEGTLAKIIGGAATGAAINAASYTPENESRINKAIEGGLLGAFPGSIVPAAKGIRYAAKTIASPFKGALKDLSPLEQKMIEAQQAHAAEENLGNETASAAQSEEQKANDLLENMKTEHKNTSENISQYLNQGASHDTRVAARLNDIINSKKKEIGKPYNEIEEDLENKKTIIKNKDDAKELNKQLIEIIKTGDTRSPQATAILERLEKVGKDKEIPARDYLATYRTTRDYLRDARKEAYTHGITDEARQKAFKRADELEEKLKEMKPILHESLGPENVEKLEKADKRWSTEIASLYGNRLYNQLTYQGHLPSNIMRELRGTGRGMSQLKEMIKNDPELLKNTVGQRYAEKPHTLHKYDEVSKEYLDKLFENPEFKTLVENHKKISDIIPFLEQQVKKIQAKSKLKSAESKKNLSLAEKMKEESKKEFEKEKQKRSAYRKKLLYSGGAYFGLKKLFSGGNPVDDNS